MWCLHKYKKIIIKTQTKPSNPFENTSKCSEHLFERLFCGLTTCIIQCENCGKYWKEECLGFENK